MTMTMMMMITTTATTTANTTDLEVGTGWTVEETDTAFGRCCTNTCTQTQI